MVLIDKLRYAVAIKKENTNLHSTNDLIKRLGVGDNSKSISIDDLSSQYFGSGIEIWIVCNFKYISPSSKAFIPYSDVLYTFWFIKIKTFFNKTVFK